MAEKDTPSKNEMKAQTRQRMVGMFESRGLIVESHSAGAVNYLSISVPDSDQNCGAIYGSRGKAASLWMKEPAWVALRDMLTDEQKDSIKVEDVDLFRRGFQWAVHFETPDDSHLELAVKACVEAGVTRWENKKVRVAKQSAAKERRIAKEAEMAEKRRSPFQ
jgi:hypothetical protein